MTDKVKLYKLSEMDLDLVRRWRNQNVQYFRKPSQITAEQQKTWYTTYVTDPTVYFYIIMFVDGDTEIAVGTISIRLKDFYKAEIHNVLLGNKDYEGRGIMSEAITQLMELFPYNIYELEVLKTNKAGIHFYEKNGFRRSAEETKDSYIFVKRYDYE